mmetsp:Transcript_87979/g.254024  ORF Transcript_87979/g.254024 Transcript_87979/m.254024 type:complete len:325 (+) Transcript_87979:718-1692(+)
MAFATSALLGRRGILGLIHGAGSVAGDVGGRVEGFRQVDVLVPVLREELGVVFVATGIWRLQCRAATGLKHGRHGHRPVPVKRLEGAHRLRLEELRAVVAPQPAGVHATERRGDSRRRQSGRQRRMGAAGRLWNWPQGLRRSAPVVLQVSQRSVPEVQQVRGPRAVDVAWCAPTADAPAAEARRSPRRRWRQREPRGGHLGRNRVRDEQPLAIRVEHRLSRSPAAHELRLVHTTEAVIATITPLVLLVAQGRRAGARGDIDPCAVVAVRKSILTGPQEVPEPVPSAIIIGTQVRMQQLRWGGAGPGVRRRQQGPVPHGGGALAR